MRAKRYRETLEAVRGWALEARKALGRATILLFGSYARGDFNLWSDIDLIIVSERFEGVPFTRRWKLLPRTHLPVEIIAWTPGEARLMLSKPSWRKALSDCIVLVDDYNLAPESCGKAANIDYIHTRGARKGKKINVKII